MLRHAQTTLIALSIAGVACAPATTESKTPPTPTPSPACSAAPGDGCIAVTLEGSREPPTYLVFVRYGVNVQPRGLGLASKAAPGALFTRSLPRGHYGLLVYRQDAEPTPGEGPECQIDFESKPDAPVLFDVTATADGACTIEDS